MLAKLKSWIKELMMHERAQISETNKIYGLFLFSVGVMVCTFGGACYLLQRYLGTGQSLVECLYFVWITLATIGYSDQGFTGSTLLRWATMIGGSYLIVRFIVLAAHVYARTVVDEVYSLGLMREMRRCLTKAQGHFLVFGDDRELMGQIIGGLLERQEVYLVSDDEKLIEDLKSTFPALKYLKAKPFKAETVDELRPEAAASAYLLYLDDAKDILLAAMLRDRVQVISMFSGNPAALPRFKQVGVTPISPYVMGALKVVSSMIRPQVTDFLDRYVFSDTAPLEFSIRPNGGSGQSGKCIPICAVDDGNIDFSSPSAQDQPALVIGFKPGTPPQRALGPIGGPRLHVKTDKFLVIGEGVIAKTVINELELTQRKITRHDSPSDAESPDERDEFDGVALCTPEDDQNFTSALDFVDSRTLQVVRTMDEDMKPHYDQIGAIPVSIGQVGAGNMLREGTNRFLNEVLRTMVSQSYRFDQAVIATTTTLGAFEAEFGLRVIAFCRKNTCRILSGVEEELKQGDTVIICGHVDANRKCRCA